MSSLPRPADPPATPPPVEAVPLYTEYPTEDTGADRSDEAFLRDLPELLNTDYRRWVAYADGVRVRLANTQTELYQHCLRDLGLTHDRFVVRLILPDAGEPIVLERRFVFEEG